ncbi:MAG: methyltransferase domain-containing protein [Patescibacteria group bacterium]
MKPTSFLNIKDILLQAGLKEGEIIADFGCGSGHFVFLAAKIVGNKGKVYAIDIQKTVLSFLKSEIIRRSAEQIKLLWANLEKPGALKIPENSVNLVLISSTLHQVKDRNKVLLEAKRVLKENGRLLIIDWKREAAPFGPSVSLRLDKDKLKKEMQEAGFKFIKEIKTGSYHFAFLAVKE